MRTRINNALSSLMNKLDCRKKRVTCSNAGYAFLLVP